MPSCLSSSQARSDQLEKRWFPISSLSTGSPLPSVDRRADYCKKARHGAYSSLWKRVSGRPSDGFGRLLARFVPEWRVNGDTPSGGTHEIPVVAVLHRRGGAGAA